MWVRQPASGSHNVQSRYVVKAETQSGLREDGVHTRNPHRMVSCALLYPKIGLATNMHSTFMHMKGDKNFIGGHLKTSDAWIRKNKKR